MRNFSRSILNYFAAYSETRFRFGATKLAFQWADGEKHSLDILDLGIFPVIQQALLDCIAGNGPVRVVATKGQNAIRVSGPSMARRLLEQVGQTLWPSVLDGLLHEYGFYVATPNPAPPTTATDLFELPIDQRKAWAEACRQYNLTLRKLFASALMEVQQAKVDELRTTLRLPNALPRTTLNARHEEQVFFDAMQLLAKDLATPEAYVQAVARWIEKADFNKFNLLPRHAGETRVEVLSDMLEKALA